MKTLNYIGCKKKISKILIDICKKNIENISELSFLDLFAGTGIITYEFAKLVKKITSNDIEYYSYCILKGLSSKISKEDYDLIFQLNKNILSQPEKCNLFEKEYSGERMFFTEQNAKKIDLIRNFINSLEGDKKYFYLASLLVSADKVANTTSVYGAFLKKFKQSALKDITLEPICDYEFLQQKYQIDVLNDWAENIKGEYDILYMDPPYNKRQYGANYCPLNFLAKYENIETRGKTGLIDYNKSDFCNKNKAIESFKTILNNIKFKYLILSYNNEGLLNFEEIKNLLISLGCLKLYKFDYNKFKASSKVVEKKVIEYIWFLKAGEKKEFDEIEI